MVLILAEKQMICCETCGAQVATGVMRIRVPQDHAQFFEHLPIKSNYCLRSNFCDSISVDKASLLEYVRDLSDDFKTAVLAVMTTCLEGDYTWLYRR